MDNKEAEKLGWRREYIRDNGVEGILWISPSGEYHSELPVDKDYQGRLARFAEYDRQSKEMNKRRISQMPWYKRMLFVTLGDVWDWLTSRNKGNNPNDNSNNT